MSATREYGQDLAERIVRGALGGDPVMMHGAVVAALETFPVAEATRLVFASALHRLGSQPTVAASVRAVIASQVAAYAGRPASGRSAAGD